MSFFGRQDDGGRVWFHWQNLNEKRGERLGLGLRHGRAWLRTAWDHELHVEWCLMTTRCGVGLQVGDGEEDIEWRFAIPPVSLYLGAASKGLRWLKKMLGMERYTAAREIDIRVHDWAIWWSLWNRPGEWSSKTPRWRHGSFHIDDALLGKRDYSTRVLVPAVAVLVPMPERSYRGVCKIEEATWARPRWFAERVITATVEMDEGEQVPIPGKGENSWDCGEDAVFSQSGPADTVPDAVANLVRSVLKTRHRRGGNDWRPERHEQAAEAT